MTFPTTPILDDFNRPDEGPPPSASWSYPSATPYGLQVVDGHCGTDPSQSDLGAGAWLPATLTDCEVYATTRANTASTQIAFFLIARAQASDDPLATCYAVRVDMVAGIATAQMYYAHDDVYPYAIVSPLDVAVSFAAGFGDAFGLSVRNSGAAVILALYHCPVGGEWVQVAQAVDALKRLPTAGYLGLGLYSDDSEIDSSAFLADFGGGPLAPTPPTAPNLLTATVLSNSQIDLAWTDNAGDETGFTVERGLDGLTFVEIATVAADATTYSDLSVTAGQHYYYRVRATSDAGDSDYSNIADAVTPVAAPTALAAKASLSTRVELAWTGVSGVDGYRVERSLDGLTFVEIATVTADGTQLADTDLSGHAVTPQTVYFYRVRAYIGAVYSDYSNVVSVITPLGGFMIDAISVSLIDALSANRSLDAIKLFIDGGTPVPVPQDKHPFVEVIIGEETPVDDLTGGVSERSYRGLLTITAQLTQTARADWLDPVEGDARRARVGSYSLIKRLVMLAQIELQREAHQDLGELVTAIDVDALTVREVVTAFRLDGSIVYGLDDRTNNYENFGSIPFVVETERSIT